MDDYISRSEAKRLIADIQLGETPKDKPRTVYQSGVYEGLNMAYGAIASMRPADVRPVVRGHFGKHISPFTAPCSECGASMNMRWNYCPHCGADMRPDQRKEET